MPISLDMTDDSKDKLEIMFALKRFKNELFVGGALGKLHNGKPSTQIELKLGATLIKG